MGTVMKGLNQAQREIIRGMVANGESGPAVRQAITKMARKDGWIYDKNVRLISELSEVGYKETAMHLEETLNRSEKCWIVTATFGDGSREWIRVRRRCSSLFRTSLFLSLGWRIYQSFGPVLADWTQSGKTPFQLCKWFLGIPIVKATDKRPLVSLPAKLYLVMLTLLGLVFLLPFKVWRRVRLPNRK